MTEERGALIEAMAQALWASATIAGKWERLSEIALEIYRIDADVALTAISNAGFAVVPKEPTPDMIRSGIIERHDQQTPEAWSLATSNIYRAMIEAGRVK